MNELSPTLKSIVLPSQSIQEVDYQDEFERRGTSTTVLKTLQSQTLTYSEFNSVIEKQLREEFNWKFVQMLHESEFEFGFSSAADEYVQSAINTFGPYTREWINDLFVCKFDDPFILCAILRVIAHLDYHQIYPQGITMATAALQHIDLGVRECAVRCFESWENPESLKILRNVSFTEDWLSEYLMDVISDLEDL